MAKSVKWDLIADPRRYISGFDKAEKRTDRFHKQIRGVATAIGGAFAAVQIGGFLKDAIDEAREAQKVGKQTAAVIKATGGVAKVSAKDVDRLADSLSRKAAVDDELIASGANLLLTFTGVRNEVGKGNDVFNQAEAAILDMTAAMNNGEISQQGLKASTIQVGKALNDPIKGITALTRVGVTFTQRQKDQIKALVESGDKMGAQKIILGELKREFQGAAAAAADPWKRVGVALDNVKERLGGVLLPMIDRASKFIVDTAIPAIDKWWKRFRDDFTPQIDRLKQAWDDNRGSFGKLLTTFAGGDKQLSNTKVQAQSLGDALTWIVTNAGKAARALDRAGAAMDLISAIVQLAAAEIHAAGTGIVLAIGQIPLAFAQAGIAVGRVMGAIDRFRGGSGKAGDAVVRTFEGIRDATQRNLAGVRGHLETTRGKVADLETRIRLARQRMSGDWASTQADAGREMRVLRQTITTTQGKINSMHGPKPIDIRAVAHASIAAQTVAWLRASHVKIPALAVGGRVTGPGGPMSDSVPAMLSAGEHVWTAREVAAAGGHRAVEGMRREVRGMAVGGRVGNLQGFVNASAGAFGKGTQHAMDILAGTLGRALGKMIDQAMAGGVGGSAAIKRFIQSVDRLPYRWGATGPAAYDCSGLVGAVYGKMRGDPRAGHGRRYFTTGSISTRVPGLRSGLGGLLSIGVTPGIGHMAGSYGGLGFEARSTRTGIFTGRAARSPSSFARKFHMASGGPVMAWAGRLAGVPGVDVAGDPSSLTVVSGRFRGLASGGMVMDRGGWLAPGWNPPIYNGTGRPEPVGLDEDRLARKIAAELAKVVPTTIRVAELEQGHNARARGLGRRPVFG